MKKETLITIAVCFILPILFTLATSVGNTKDFFQILGLCFFCAALIYIIPGIILAIIESTRKVGMGILLSSALLLLVGFSVCSMVGSNNFH